MGVFHEFLTKSPTKMYFKKNPFLDNIKLSTHIQIDIYFVIFKIVGVKFAESLSILLEFWDFSP